MKSLLLTLLAVFGTTVSSAQFLETADGLIMFINAAVIPAPVVPDLMIQEFETGTLPSGWGSEGGPIYNYTPPLRGNYSLGLLDTDGSYYTFLSGESELYLFFEYKRPTLPEYNNAIVELYSSSYVENDAEVDVLPSGIILVDSTGNYPTSSSQTTGVMSSNTLYYIGIHYKVGVGANSIIEAGFSTSLPILTNGVNWASSTNGNATGLPIYFYLENEIGSSGVNIFDHVGAATFPLWTGITNAP